MTSKSSLCHYHHFPLSLELDSCLLSNTTTTTTTTKVNLAKTKLDMTVRQVAAGGQHSALVGNVRSADKP